MNSAIHDPAPKDGNTTGVPRESRLWQAHQAIPGPVRQVETTPGPSIANSIDSHTSIDS